MNATKNGIAGAETANEEIPFNLERKGDILEITLKPPKSLSKKELAKFERNKRTVRMILFDEEKVIRLSNMQANFSNQSLLHKVLKRLGFV